MRCPPGKREVFFWDANCGGFGIRTLSSGRRSWIFQYRDEHKRTRRIALGDVSAVSLEAARAAARRHAAAVTQGGNPSVQRKSRHRVASVLHIIEAYLSDAKTRQRPRSYKETERHLRRHAAPLHHERAEAVRRRDVATLLERVTKRSEPIAANRVRAALSALWTWGLRTGRIEADSNPVSFTVRHPEKSRERTLTDAEMKAIWNAVNGDDAYSRIVRLCLLTGCRREEIGGLRWDEVDRDHLVVGAKRMKGGIVHEIAILPMIAAALPCRPETSQDCVFGRRGTGFSGWSKSKRELDARITSAGIAMPRWGLHDLRRTFSIVAEDPVRRGLVASLARPGGNLTGVNFLTTELAAKRLELLRELVPAATHLAVLVNPANAAATETMLGDLEPAARAMGLQIQVRNASTGPEINAVFATFVRERPDALFVNLDPFFTSRRVQLATLATRHAVPMASGNRQITEAGGLMSYGASNTDAWRQAGLYSGRILKGAKPADLPVVQASKFELVINAETARMLGLTVPPSLLATADEVIE